LIQRFFIFIIGPPPGKVKAQQQRGKTFPGAKRRRRAARQKKYRAPLTGTGRFGILWLEKTNYMNGGSAFLFHPLVSFT
jgi:hypothetical protein